MTPDFFVWGFLVIFTYNQLILYTMKNLETLALATVFFASAAGLIALALTPQPMESLPLLAFTFAALFSMSAKMLITFEK
jgi:hypothetical protein